MLTCRLEMIRCMMLCQIHNTSVFVQTKSLKLIHYVLLQLQQVI